MDENAPLKWRITLMIIGVFRYLPGRPFLPREIHARSYPPWNTTVSHQQHDEINHQAIPPLLHDRTTHRNWQRVLINRYMHDPPVDTVMEGFVSKYPRWPVPLQRGDITAIGTRNHNRGSQGKWRDWRRQEMRWGWASLDRLGWLIGSMAWDYVWPCLKRDKTHRWGRRETLAGG